MYKLTNGGVIRLNDNGFVAESTGNKDYQEYLAWVAAGNTPQPASSRDDDIAFVNDKIDKKLNQIRNGGVFVDNSWFATDIDSRVQYLLLSNIQVDFPQNLKIPAMTGTLINTNHDLVMSIVYAIAVLDMNSFANSRSHKDAVAIADFPLEYDYSTGWAQIYG